MADVIPLGSFGKTTACGVSTVSYPFTIPGPYTAYVVTSERNIHIALNRDATTDDFKLVQGNYARVEALAGDSINVILAVGETDGNAWVTEVS